MEKDAEGVAAKTAEVEETLPHQAVAQKEVQSEKVEKETGVATREEELQCREAALMEVQSEKAKEVEYPRETTGWAKPPQARAKDVEEEVALTAQEELALIPSVYAVKQEGQLKQPPG